MAGSRKSINFVLHEVQTIDPRAKIRNLSGSARRGHHHSYCSTHRCQQIHSKREIHRNSNSHGRYSWKIAHERAKDRKERSPGNHALKDEVKKTVQKLIVEEDWSPKQISGYLRRQGVHVSHESIYAMIRSDSSGELRSHCRHKMKYRRRPKDGSGKAGIKSIPDGVSIHDRPSEADGHRFGDWEMDLIIGKDNHDAILTLCERSVNYMMMCKLPDGKSADGVSEAVIRLLRQYRANVLTITTDNGTEFARHRRIADALETTVYFSDAYSSWQKGAIENTNKLIRQYIPKGTDFSTLTDEFVHSVQLKLNRRPREKLNFSTPKDEFFKNLL